MDLFIEKLLTLDITTWLVIAIIAAFFFTKTFKWFGKLFEKGKVKKLTLPGGAGIEFGEEGKKTSNASKAPPHKSCPYVKDVYQALIKVISITVEITKIEIKEVLASQMFFVEEQLFLMREKMKRGYMSLVAKKLKDSRKGRISANNHYKNYSVVIDLLMRQTQGYVKKDLLCDDFENISLDGMESFENFIKDKIQKTKDQWSEYFDAFYTGDDVVTRSELQDMHEGLYSDTENIVRRIYAKSKEVIIEKHKEKEELKEEMNDYIKEKIGETINGS